MKQIKIVPKGDYHRKSLQKVNDNNSKSHNNSFAAAN